MNKHIQRLKKILIDHPLDEIMDTLEQEGSKQALKKAVPFLLATVGVVGFFAVVLLALFYAVRKTIWKVIILAVMGWVLWASYLENHKSSVGPTTTKEPTMAQYITVGNIVKIAARRVAPILELSPIYDETDIKAAKDEKIIPCEKYWLFKYRFLKKSSVAPIDTDMAEEVLQSEIQTVLDNENPAGFDKVRFVYEGIDECILQVDHVSQGRAYLYVYCCFASEAYFSEHEQEDGENETVSTDDFEF